MPAERDKPTQNFGRVLMAVTDDADEFPRMLKVDPVTDRLLVDVGTLEIDPPVGGATAANQTTIIGHVDGIEALLTTIDGRVDGIETLIGTTNTTLTTIDGRVDGIEALLGTIDTDTGNIDTSLNNLEKYAVGPGGATAVDSYTHASITAAAGADRELVAAPGANKQIWVYGIGFTLSLAGSASFQDSDNTAISGVMLFAQYSGLNTPPSGNFAMPIWKVATNKALEVDLVTAAMTGWIDYAIVSV